MPILQNCTQVEVETLKLTLHWNKDPQDKQLLQPGLQIPSVCGDSGKI